MSTLTMSAPTALNPIVPNIRKVIDVDSRFAPGSSKATTPLHSAVGGDWQLGGGAARVNGVTGHYVQSTSIQRGTSETAQTSVTPPKVVIVGAGISGLRAAHILQRHGVDVTVLEGRPDRIGGRIHTSRRPGKAPRDIGAAWMHETSQNKLVKLIPKLGIEYYYDDGTPLYYTREGRAGSQFKAKKVADEFADYCEWYYETHPEAEDLSVADSIQKFVTDHPLLTEDERQWAPEAARETELWLGTSMDYASAKHLSYFVTERNLYIKGGYDKLIDWAAAPLKAKSADTVRLGHVVNQVEQKDDGKTVVVHATNDSASHSFVADAVIVTAPLGVLRREMIDFSPKLPADISAGLKSISYGALGKVFIEFSEVFWSKDNDQFIYYPSPSANKNLDGNNILSWATVTSNLFVMSEARELCIQIAEPLTQRIEAMTDKDEVFRFFEPLFKLMRTEPHKSLPPVINLETTRWTLDPFSGFGTYSVEKTGDDPDRLMDALERNKGSRLQFAGEHTTKVGNGCVHGAFISGETAAHNLLATLGIARLPGDDLTL